MLTVPNVPTARRGDGETGSVIVALVVVVVVAMGLVALFANVNSSLNLTRNDQNRTNAFSWRTPAWTKPSTGSTRRRYPW